MFNLSTITSSLKSRSLSRYRLAKENKTAYDLILSKQAELSTIITKCAVENRAPSPEEVTQLNAAKAEIETIRAEWESAGRNAFLASLGVAKTSNEIPVLKSGESFAKHVEGTYPEEFKSVSLRKILRGYITGQWDGAELEQKATASTPLSAGGVMIPTPVAASVIDPGRNQTRLVQAGAITVPMTTASLRYARLTEDVPANWTLEANNITLGAAAFDSVTFTAHKLAALVAINNELLEDAPNADGVIENSIARSIAIALDIAGLFGPGVAPQPLGLKNGGSNSITPPPSAPYYDTFLSAIAEIRSYNYEPNAVIYGPGTARSLSMSKSTQNEYLMPPADFAALQKFVTNAVENQSGNGTSDAFVGQWNQLALGLRSSLQIEVSREASYYDGSALQSAFSKDQTVIRAILRADWQSLHSGAFCVIPGIANS